MGQDQSRRAISPEQHEPTRRRRQAAVSARRGPRVEQTLRLSPIVLPPQVLPAQECPFRVRESQQLVERVVVPMQQDVYQPVIQPVVRRAHPVLDTRVTREFQPILTRRLIPDFKREVRNGAPAPLVRTAPVVTNVRRRPVVRQERVSLPCPPPPPCAGVIGTVGGGEQLFEFDDEDDEDLE